MDGLNYLNIVLVCIINPKDIARSLCQECADNIRKFTKFKQKCLKSASVWESKKTLMPEFEMRLRKTDKEISEVGTNDESESINYEELEESPNNIDELFKPENENGNNYSFHADNQELEQNHNNTADELSMSENDTNYSFNAENSREQCKEQDIDSYDSPDCINKDLIGESTVQSVHFQDKYSNENPIDPNDVIESLSTEKMNCKCGRQFNYSMNYKKHIKRCYTLKFFQHRSKIQPMLEKCGLCEFSTQDIEMLFKHFDDHFKRNDVECQLCDYTGRDFSEMVDHWFSHTSETNLYCMKCHKPFKHPKSLQLHFRSVHLNKNGLFCSFCSIQLSNLRNLRNHVWRKHTDENVLKEADSLFICDCCGLRFVRRYEIVTHLRQRAGLTKIVCNECGASFKRQQNLNAHIKNVHTHQEKVTCPICSTVCKANFIKKHIEFMHGEKNFICEICSKKFSTKNNLRYHMLAHTNERPHKCSKCTADYKTKSLLRVHMLKHAGIKRLKKKTDLNPTFRVEDV